MDGKAFRMSCLKDLSEREQRLGDSERRNISGGRM